MGLFFDPILYFHILPATNLPDLVCLHIAHAGSRETGKKE